MNCMSKSKKKNCALFSMQLFTCQIVISKNGKIFIWWNECKYLESIKQYLETCLKNATCDSCDSIIVSFNSCYKEKSILTIVNAVS